MSSSFSLNDIFDKLRSKATTVAVNISSSSIVEIMEIDKNGMINAYASVPIQYNQITKELENIADFQSALKRTFSELGISLASKVYVSMPTYVIDHENLPKVDDDDAIKTMLTSAVESNYIFRKYDPAISFYKLPEDESGMNANLSICYTALRADEYIKIIGVFEEIGIKVVAVDSSYSSLINGVIATQKVNPTLISQRGSWNILNITSNSYMIFGMRGRDLVSVYEEPLAVKSFTEEEIYQVISSSLDNVIGNYPAEQLIIVSQSDNVSAEYLTDVLHIDCSKTYIDDNRYRKQLVDVSFNITQSNKLKISLEAVGISTYPSHSTGIRFNFLDAPIEVAAAVESIFVNIGGQDIELTSVKIQKVCLFIGLLVACIWGVVFWLLNTFESGALAEQESYTHQITKIQKELDIKPQTVGISESEFLQKNYTHNVNYKKSYAALGREIPDMLWIEEFQLSDDSKLYIAGRSYRMDDVLNYYDSLNKIGKYENLKISTLKISNSPISDLLLNKNSDMVEETTYEFAFGHKVYYEPAPPALDLNDKGSKDSDAVPPPPIGSEEVAPPPTSVPKQDS